MRHTNSSVFPMREPKPVGPDCLPDAPGLVVFYDGSNNLVPVLRNGQLYFEGGLANSAPGGIFQEGESDYVSLRRDEIKPGMAGVKVRCTIVAAKQRLRFRIDPGVPIESQITFRLRPISTCLKPLEYSEEMPVWIFYAQGFTDTPCKKLYALKDMFDRQYAHLANSYVLLDETGQYCFDIETKIAGEFFQVESHAGLTKPSVVVPGQPATFTPDILYKWLNIAGVTGNLKVLELFSTTMVQGELLSALTSNFADAPHVPRLQNVTSTIIFADNAQANTARAALLAILERDSDQIEDLLRSQACADVTYYPFTIERSDDGSAAAIATLKSDYSAVSVALVGRGNGGKSYYTITLATTVAPVKVGDDVVKAGTASPVTGGFVSPCA